MKGIFIENSIEYRLEIEGEDFYQGDTLHCSFSTKNHSGQKVALPGLKIALAIADLKKIKKKDEGAFAILSEKEEAAFELEPGASHSTVRDFELALDCCVSDKSSSLYFLCGQASNPSGGQFALVVQPHRHISQIAELLESAFQFVNKGFKNSKGYVQYKLKPSSARRFFLLEELLLNCRFSEENLQLQYNFRLKSLSATETELGVKKRKSVFEQEFEPKDFLIDDNHLNHNFLEKELEQALSTVASGL